MRAHLEIVKPDIVIVTPLASSYRDDHQGLEVLREEVAVLCRQAAQAHAPVLLCADDPAVTALAAELPQATRFSTSDLAPGDSGALLQIDGAVWPVKRDTVGSSGRCAVAVAVRVGRLLGMSDDDLRGFLER